MNEYKEISKELIQLAKVDSEVRDRLLAEGKLSDGYNPEMKQTHVQNSQRLREIIAKIGFPTISKVGIEANDAAWLIIQHSISEPKFMKESLEVMKNDSSDINPKHIAYLYDRIQVYEGKPQKFGTQLLADYSIYPVEDMENLNIYRKENGLETLPKSAIDKIKPATEIPEIEKADPAYITWLYETGWRK